MLCSRVSTGLTDFNVRSPFRPERQRLLLNHILQTIQQYKPALKRKPKKRKTLYGESASSCHWRYTRYALHRKHSNYNIPLTFLQINPDGHCLFSAVADQLVLLGLILPAEATYANLRIAAANYIHSHPDDFLPFLPSSGGEDGAGALDAGMMNRAGFDSYCTSIRDTAVWGGEPEIVALSRAFNVPIHVVQGGQPPVVVHNPAGDQQGSISAPGAVRISYHRKLYGLGEASINRLCSSATLFMIMIVSIIIL